jgi:hypothetical protein
VKHVTTTPYYPQDSLAERVNRNFKSALKIYHAQSQDKWDVDLPWFATALNTAMHERTKFTPDKLFLGRELTNPLSVKWDLSPESVADQQGPNQMFWTQAFENLKQARDRVAGRYDQNRRNHQYAVGDSVMYRRNLVSSKALNVSGKLMHRWSEPLVIAKLVRNNGVLLANPDTGVIVRRAQVGQLKRYVR